MATDNLSTAESIAGQTPDSDFLRSLLHHVDREQLAELSGLSLSEVSSLFAPPSEPDVPKPDIEMLELDSYEVSFRPIQSFG